MIATFDDFKTRALELAAFAEQTTAKLAVFEYWFGNVHLNDARSLVTTLEAVTAISTHDVELVDKLTSLLCSVRLTTHRAILEAERFGLTEVQLQQLAYVDEVATELEAWIGTVEVSREVSFSVADYQACIDRLVGLGEALAALRPPNAEERIWGFAQSICQSIVRLQAMTHNSNMADAIFRKAADLRWLIHECKNQIVYIKGYSEVMVMVGQKDGTLTEDCHALTDRIRAEAVQLDQYHNEALPRFRIPC
ncbi:MAG: hypothetical protein ACOYL5_01110 [Phototrophicaceae bacterium]